VDAVSFGPGAPEQAHQAGEYASVQAMVQHYRVLEHFLTREPETPA
jgi:acetylornithine deacetylase/succinyl-diaminopimelate desuccinylase-like protein